MKKYLSLIVLLLVAAVPASAQEVPRTKAEMGLSFSPVVKKAAPAVVNIFTSSKVQVMQSVSPFANDPFFKQFFGQNFQFGGVPREQVVNSLGSGVIVGSDGMVVTSHHVIKDAQEIKVVLSDKREFPAKVLARDPQSDLALLKIDGKDLPHLDLRDSDTLEVGDLVLAIGNPFGVGQTVTNGIVSGLARKAAGVSDYQFFIQTDAAINPGNSGGALVDMNGTLIGINTAIYSTAGGSNGIGFAIPANMVRSLMGSKVAESGRVLRPWVGVSVQPVTAEIAESVGMKSPQGIIVRAISPGSPAEKAGLKTSDVILAVNDAEVASGQDLQYRLALGKIGDSAAFKIQRGGEAKTLAVELAVPAENPKRDQRTLSGQHPLSGAVVANLSPALALEIGMDEGARGVVVLAYNGGAQLNVGMRPGDIILEVNGTKITSSSQLDALMKKDARNWQVAYLRGGNIMKLTVQM